MTEERFVVECLCRTGGGDTPGPSPCAGGSGATPLAHLRVSPAFSDPRTARYRRPARRGFSLSFVMHVDVYTLFRAFPLPRCDVAALSRLFSRPVSPLSPGMLSSPGPAAFEMRSRDTGPEHPLPAALSRADKTPIKLPLYCPSRLVFVSFQPLLVSGQLTR